MWAADTWEGMEGGGGEVEILVEAIRTIDVLTVASASCGSEPLTAEIITVASASVEHEIYTAECADAMEATI